MEIARLLPEPSPATRGAYEVAAAFQTPALLEHCSRSYLWAASHGDRTGLAFDRELLFVAAMLHDLGLSGAFDNATNAFESAGGDVAWVFAAGAGWTAQRRSRVREIIVRHMHAEAPAAGLDPESHLLHLATSFDISGRDAELWPAPLRRVVLEQHPRGGLAEEFIGLFIDQAQRKPGCAAAASVDGGLARRISANPLDD